MSDSKKNFWLTPNGLSAIALIGAAMYFLLSEHRAHFIYFLPYLVLLLCPVMHIFMHRGHGDHGGQGNSHDHQSKEEDE
ncbi:MAG: DUF2933 domain-containing protein [Gammaproteobacteria bacterium]|nr:DUF2933 domain-containing protein [Gammaproteobacteria bacterium]